MDWKVDLDVTCKHCGMSACRIYKEGDIVIRYKCYSACGEYSVIEDIKETNKELVDTKPMKARNKNQPVSSKSAREEL